MAVRILTIATAFVGWALLSSAYSGDPRLARGSDYIEYVEHLQSVLERDASDTLKLEVLKNCSFVIKEYWGKSGFLDLFWGRLTRETDVKRVVFSLEVGRYSPGVLLPLPYGFELVTDDPPLERYWAIAIVETEDTYLLARWSSEPDDFLSAGELLIENDSSRQIAYVEVSECEVRSFIDSIRTYYSQFYSTNIYVYPLARSKHILEGRRTHSRPEFAFFTVNDTGTSHTSFVPYVRTDLFDGNNIVELHCFLDMLCSPNRWAPWICKDETWNDVEKR